MTRNRSPFRQRNRTSKRDSKSAKIIGAGISVRARKRRSGNNYSKATNIGSGSELKSSAPKSPFTSTIRKGNWPSNRTAGKKATSPLLMSSRKRPAVISSLSQSKNRPKNGGTGHWFTDSVV